MTEHLLLAADSSKDQVPAGVQITVAVIAVLGVLATALFSFVAARTSAGAARSAAESAAGAARSAAESAAGAQTFVATSDRFADWQLHKRDLYAKLLDSIRSAETPGDAAATAEMNRALDCAVLAAHPALRDYLLTNKGSLSARGDELSCLMHEDVNR